MKQDELKCVLCNTNMELYKAYKTKSYYRCPTCESVQMNPKDYLQGEEEKARYLTHNNDVDDIRYQSFVSPIVKAVQEKFTSDKKGLDFGAGTGPVITKLLEERGYKMALYDPFFWNDPTVLEHKYDFIVSCEVIEHFHNPKQELQRLKALLVDRGSLIVMTDLIYDAINFDKWYYKNDPTHVIFYHINTFNWIKEHIGFKHLSINERLIELSL